MKKAFLVLSIIIFLMNSCMSSKVVRLSTSIRQPVAGEMVVTFQTEFDVPSEFEKIAVVTVKGSAIYNTKAGLLKRLREKAGQIGANAIILAGGKDKSLAYKAASVYFTAGIIGGREYSAIAIYIYPEKK